MSIFPLTHFNKIFKNSSPTIVVGDLNAASELWFYDHHNSKGAMTAETVEERGFVVFNGKIRPLLI